MTLTVSEPTGHLEHENLRDENLCHPAGESKTDTDFLTQISLMLNLTQVKIASLRI